MSEGTMRLRSTLMGMGIVAALLGRAHVATACGGCLQPPPAPMQSITVITDHRMAFAVSPKNTTLYDQIRYQGDPAAFAWVLPISDTVEVALSADVLFGSLDLLTQTTITAPQLPPCPPPPFCGYGYGGGGGGCGCGFSSASNKAFADDGGAGSFSDSAPAPPPVEVTKHEVVGPYDTVQLKATNPTALDDWLAANGFVIPDDVKPVIAAYQSEGYGFLALKLLPGKSVTSMRPVRVTTQGAGLTLPLRMVSAGTGANVGITLWIVAEGRYEPSNFASFRIPDDEIVWDWSSRSSNYTQLRADKTAKGNGEVWELESSLDLQRIAIERFILSGGKGFGTAPATGDYLPVMDPKNPNVIVKTADQVRQEDLDALLSGMQQVGRVTRLRADLAHAALVKDLQLTASMDQTQVTSNHDVTKDVNRPQCPTYPPCPDTTVERAGGGGGCSAAADGASSAGLGIGTGILALSIMRRRRRR